MEYLVCNDPCHVNIEQARLETNENKVLLLIVNQRKVEKGGNLTKKVKSQMQTSCCTAQLRDRVQVVTDTAVNQCISLAPAPLNTVVDSLQGCAD